MKQFAFIVVNDKACKLVLPADFKDEFLNAMVDADSIPVVLRWWKDEPTLNQNQRSAIYTLVFDPRHTLAEAQELAGKLLNEYFAPPRATGGYVKAGEFYRVGDLAIAVSDTPLSLESVQAAARRGINTQTNASDWNKKRLDVIEDELENGKP